MADPQLYIPELNPVIFYDTTRANLPKYFTKHFEYWSYMERLYYWQQREDYHQVWQDDDIINLQFISNCDPIIVYLLDTYGNIKITLPTLIGLPDLGKPGFYSFQASMSLAGLATGCYRIKIEAGVGDDKKILISDCQFISSEPIINTLLIEYWNSRFTKDVIFETGIKFQFRVHGTFGFLDKPRIEERSRNQRNNSVLLSSKSAKQWPVYFGDQYGIPDDIYNLIDEIWGVDNVYIDNKAFGLAEGSKAEFVSTERYPKRGIKYMVEAGLNRSSRIYSITTDVSKKLVTSVLVEAKVFGDTSNQGSANTVPVPNIE